MVCESRHFVHGSLFPGSSQIILWCFLRTNSLVFCTGKKKRVMYRPKVYTKLYNSQSDQLAVWVLSTLSQLQSGVSETNSRRHTGHFYSLCTHCVSIISFCGILWKSGRVMVARFSPRRSGFAPRSVQVRSAVDKVASRRVIPRALGTNFTNDPY